MARELPTDAFSILDHIPSGMCVLRDDLTIVFWNRTLEAWTEVSREQLIGKQFFDYFPHLNKTMYQDRFRQVFEGTPAAIFSSQIHQHIIPCPLPDGSDRFQQAGFSRLPFESNKHSYGLLSIEDVTDITNIAQKYKKQKRELSETILELDIVAKERQQLVQEAQQKSRYKTEFLSNMSHEIRTPMNGVIGMTSLLRTTGLTSEQSEYIETIRSSGEVLLTIINDILDFSKIEAGKIELEEVDFNIREAIEQTLRVFSHHIETKGLSVTSHVDAKIPTVIQGDPSRLRQILFNLINNAIKFTDEGEVLIRVENIASKSSEMKLRFEIKDTGPGMNSEQTNKLFTPFCQLDSSTTRQFGGTGLGLSIAKRLVGLMNGTIGVNSEIGKGSTFWFEVRLNKLPSQGLKPRPSLKSKTFLVVSSNAVLKESLVNSLKDRGLKGSAVEELTQKRLASDGEVDILLIDIKTIHLKKKNCWEFLRKFKAVKGARIILIGPPLKISQTLVPEDIVNATLKTPVRQSDLYAKVAGILAEEKVSSTKRGSVIPLKYSKPVKGGTKPIVLVADDNLVNQKVAAWMLEKLGYQVDSVADGMEALEAFKTVPYDAILMDCMMPEMDGYEATREIRKIKGGHNIPIIALTANAMPEDAKKCLAAGMDDYLPKPVRLEDLQRVLDKWIAARTMDKAA